MHLVLRSGRLDRKRVVRVGGRVGLGGRIVRRGDLGSEFAVQIGAGQERLARGASQAVIFVRAGGF